MNTYVATPTIDYPKDKVVLFLTDVFGPQLVNAQLLADDFARSGFKVCFSFFSLPRSQVLCDRLIGEFAQTIVPDYLNGDPVPADAMDPGVRTLPPLSYPLRHSPRTDTITIKRKPSTSKNGLLTTQKPTPDLPSTRSSKCSRRRG